jgi:DNA-binding GntR family transcriptional regulator
MTLMVCSAQMAQDLRLPTYLRVADRLEREIARQEAGTLLPSENELARRFEMNRLTARAALDELERRYLVRRAQGRGTFVASRIDYVLGPNVPPSWSERLRRAGHVPRTQTERMRLKLPPADVRTTLGLPAGEEAIFVARRRFVDETLAAYAESWLAADLLPEFITRLPAEGSMHRAFDDLYALEPYSASVKAEFVVAPLAVARKLEDEGRPMVFQLVGVTASRVAARPIQVTTSWLRADVFRVVFEMGDDP